MAKEDLNTLGYNEEAESLREKVSKGGASVGQGGGEKEGAGASVGSSLRGEEFIGGVTVAKQNARNKFG